MINTRNDHPILFLMPHDGIIPAGGYKVVYEYANRLVADGYKITLVYPNTKKWNRNRGMAWLKDVARFVVRGISKGYRSAWFPLNKKIHQRWVWSLDCFKYHKNDIVVATAIETVYYLNEYKLPKEQKYYFIQDFEDWFFTKEQVTETYHFSMNKIVISQWLNKIVKDCHEIATFIPNGFDFNFFHYSKPVEQRNRYHIVCMYHVDKRKGLDIAFAAFRIAKAKYKELHVTLFSVYDKPEGLPEWYHFHKKPDRQTFNDLYNHASIYVGSSYTEGWGLTVGEAMQCGCAVACTDNKGYLEMVRHNKTALVSHVGDAQALADNIIRLIEDDALRIRIATNGEKYIHQFDIEKSYKKFRNTLTSDK